MHTIAPSKRTRSRYVLAIAAAAAALAAGVLYTPRADAKTDYLTSCALVSIKTDQNGTIDVITYMRMNKTQTIKGCGAKIANLPHVVEALQLNKTIDMTDEDGCLKAVTVNKP